MSQPIFPVEITEHSIEQHWAEHSTRSQIIYLTLVLVVIGALVSLPFVYVDVSVHGGGLLRPVTEKTEVKSPVSGKVTEVLVQDNQAVEKGQPLLTIQTDQLDQQLAYHDQRVGELDEYIRDLTQLLALPSPTTATVVSLTSSLYHQSYREFRQKAAEIDTRSRQARREYDRAVLLAKEQVIARKEVEDRRLTLDMAEAELRSLVAQQRNQWQITLREYRQERSRSVVDAQGIKKEKEQYRLTAPEAGTIQNLSGIYPGSYVTANQLLAEVSPDSRLVLESYLSPTDIGFLKAGMPIKVQIDAFNYNEWGLATGRVLSVANDVTIIDQQPVFKVRSVLDQDHLSLRTGYQGRLKKGMTGQVHFLVNRRNLYQLLYDKVDHWLNPATEGSKE